MSFGWGWSPDKRERYSRGPTRLLMRGQMQPTRIGNFEVARVADYEGPFFAPGDFFPDFDPAVVEENAALLGPRLIEAGTRKLIFSFSSFVFQNRPHTILVDVCLGNDKERPTPPP